jgi:Mrp family chromosome partitioning ATPase
LLGSPRFKQLLENLRGQYDVVLVDSPALLAVSDPGVVAQQVDGVLLVVRPSRHDGPDAERAVELLHTLGTTPLGVVVNDSAGRLVHARDESSYQFEHYQAVAGTNTPQAEAVGLTKP